MAKLVFSLIIFKSSIKLKWELLKTINNYAKIIVIIKFRKKIIK